MHESLARAVSLGCCLALTMVAAGCAEVDPRDCEVVVQPDQSVLCVDGEGRALGPAARGRAVVELRAGDGFEDLVRSVGPVALRVLAETGSDRGGVFLGPLLTACLQDETLRFQALDVRLSTSTEEDRTGWFTAEIVEGAKVEQRPLGWVARENGADMVSSLVLEASAAVPCDGATQIHANWVGLGDGFYGTPSFFECGQEGIDFSGAQTAAHGEPVEVALSCAPERAVPVQVVDVDAMEREYHLESFPPDVTPPVSE